MPQEPMMSSHVWVRTLIACKLKNIEFAAYCFAIKIHLLKWVNCWLTYKMGGSTENSYGSWIYNYLCYRCLSPLMLWVRLSLRARYTPLCDKVRGVATLGLSRHVPIHKFDKSAWSTVGCTRYLSNRFLCCCFVSWSYYDWPWREGRSLFKCYFEIFNSSVNKLFTKTWHRSSRSCNNISQNCNSEIPMKGTMFMSGELCLIYKACGIASEFEIEASRPCVVGRQRNRANYPVEYPSYLNPANLQT